MVTALTMTTTAPKTGLNRSVGLVLVSDLMTKTSADLIARSNRPHRYIWPVATCAFVSFRLGLTDGVSVVAQAWQEAFQNLGWDTYTVAGDGPVDHRIAGLGIDAIDPPDQNEVDAALVNADLTVVENILSIPLNLPASRAIVRSLTKRPALLHHHDPPWQRERFAHIAELPPDQPLWRHVTINHLTRQQFADRGITATTIYNGFDTSPPPGDRSKTRTALGLTEETRLLAHPVRAIARKNIPAALQLCQNVGATYWLPGPAEEGYEAELAALLNQAECPILRAPIDGDSLAMADLYAASDLVVFPSTWEGFGNPPIEAALHRRLACVGDYAVADELRALGFDWFNTNAYTEIDTALVSWFGNELWARPDEDPSIAARIENNRQLAEAEFSADHMTAQIQALLIEAGWSE